MAAAATLDLTGQPPLSSHMIPVPASTSFVHAPVANTAAVVTVDADAARPNIIGQVTASYNAAPTGGYLQIENGSGSVVWKMYIAAAGVFDFVFQPPLVFSQNTAAIVTLSAGGASATGSVAVTAWKYQ